jgi:hypothetical protein
MVRLTTLSLCKRDKSTSQGHNTEIGKDSVEEDERIIVYKDSNGIYRVPNSDAKHRRYNMG